MNIEERYRQVQEKVTTDERPFTAEELVKKFEASLDWEREGLPKPEVTVFLGWHTNEQDVESMRPQFEQCQVYVPENGGYTDGIRDGYERVASGSMDPAVALFERGYDDPDLPAYGYVRAELEMLHRSNKVIVMLDIPAEHSLTQKIREAVTDYYQIPPVDSFDTALDITRDRAKKYVVCQGEREQYMIEQFPVKFREVIRQHPELAQRERVNVLVRLGAEHVSMVSRFIEAGIPSLAEYQDEKSHLPHSILFQALRRGNVIQEEMPARVLLLNLVADRAPEFSRWFLADVEGRASKVVGFSNSLLTEQIKELWEEDRKKPLSVSRLRPLLESHGIVFS